VVPIALGEPSWRINVDGRWDFVPLAIAAIALVVLRVLFGVRIRPWIVLAVVLAAPLYAAVAGAVGYPLASAVTCAFTLVAAVAVRRTRRARPGPAGTV
jgi:integral membrane sensor domain MASE1